VWHREGLVEVKRGTFRDGREWATQTTEMSHQCTLTSNAYTIATLLDRFAFPRIDLLKIDIEGAELQLFRDGNTDFMDRTACCAIECHGSECFEAFREVAVRHDFELSESGELHIATRRPGSPKPTLAIAEAS
jgi:hypothetical protein